MVLYFFILYILSILQLLQLIFEAIIIFLSLFAQKLPYFDLHFRLFFIQLIQNLCIMFRLLFWWLFIILQSLFQTVQLHLISRFHILQLITISQGQSMIGKGSVLSLEQLFEIFLHIETFEFDHVDSLLHFEITRIGYISIFSGHFLHSVKSALYTV